MLLLAIVLILVAAGLAWFARNEGVRIAYYGAVLLFVVGVICLVVWLVNLADDETTTALVRHALG